MITYHDPRPITSVQPRPYGLRVAQEPITLGLLANGFFDSVTFLDLVAEELDAHLPIARVLRWNKGNFSMPATEPIIDEIAATCGAVLQAFGH